MISNAHYLLEMIRGECTLVKTCTCVNICM